jgi:hypothetical protein
MVEAVRTTASPAAIWMIVIVAVVVLAAWLTAVMLADRYQVRTSGRWRMTREAELASGETQAAADHAWATEGLAGEDTQEIPGAAAREPVGARGRTARDGSVPEAEIPTRVDIPAQSAGPDAMPTPPVQAPPPQVQPAQVQPAQVQPARQHTMPAQRSGDADRAERSYAGPPPDEDEQGQPGPQP